MGKKEQEGEDLGKGISGWKTPPLLFPDITDHLTQINNLSPPKDVAREGRGTKTIQWVRGSRC